MQRKNPRVIAWTQVYRRQHKKGEYSAAYCCCLVELTGACLSHTGVADQAQKKKTKKTVKYQRGYVGATLTDIAAKKLKATQTREEHQAAAIAKAKEEKKERDTTKKPREKVAKPAQQPKLSKRQVRAKGAGGPKGPR
ncbi:60S ribosomal protein L24 [Tulasnella sp. 403]|nr:60S ribosomal protein L24 [Tulasnella sp. 403]